MINTGRVQPPSPRRKRPVWPFVVAGLLALCCGLPVAGAGAWFIRETVKVSEGPAYPSIAVGDFIWMGFDPWADSERLFTVVCDKQEDKILSQADGYRGQLDRLAQQWNESYKLSLGPGKTDEQGKRATVSQEIVIDWQMKPEPGEIIGSTRRKTVNWTFDLVKEGGLDPGWKVCGFTAPDPD